MTTRRHLFELLAGASAAALGMPSPRPTVRPLLAVASTGGFGFTDAADFNSWQTATAAEILADVQALSRERGLHFHADVQTSYR